MNGRTEGTRESSTLKARAAVEARRFVLIFLYLWVLFGLFVLNERIILHQRGITFSTQGFAVLNAFVLAKVMLIAEDFRFGSWIASKRPLIYSIALESALFSVLFIAFHIFERVIAGRLAGEAFAASVPAIGGGGLAGVLCVAAILFVSLLPFFGFRGVDRALGDGRLRALLFGSVHQVPGEFL